MTFDSRRFQSLDLWRGAAALLVVVAHAIRSSYPHITRTHTLASDAHLERLCNYIVGALNLLRDVGVPLFFVISGYCITVACERSPLLPYLKRRFVRIYPSYWGALAAHTLLLFVAASWVPGFPTASKDLFPPWSLSASQWIGNLTLSETWRPLVGGERAHFALLPAWTLCYEAQFYLVMGLVALAPRKYFAPLIAAISMLSLALVFGTKVRHPLSFGLFFDHRWLIFAAGVVVRLVHRNGGRAGTRAAYVLFFLLAVLGYSQKLSGVTTAGIFSSFLLMSARWDRQGYEWKAMGPLRFLGRISYSLYLTHIFFAVGISQYFLNLGMKTSVDLVLIVIPLVVAASVLYATCFYYLVERHFVSRGDETPAAQQLRHRQVA